MTVSRRIRRVGVGLGTLGLMAILGAGEAAKTAPATGAATQKAEPAKREVSGEGTLAAVDPFEVKLKFKVYSGPLTVVNAAANGAAVKKGETVLELEQTEFKWAFTGMENALAAARAGMVKAQSDFELGQKGDALAMRMQEDALKNAQNAVKWWETMDGPQMLLSADMSLKQWKDNVSDQEDELDQLRKMYKSEELTNATADIVVKRALRKLDQSKIYEQMNEQRTNKTKTNDYAIARQRVLDALEQSKQAMAALKASQELSKVTRNNALSAAKIALEQAEAKMKDYLADKELLSIKAPSDGVVVYAIANESNGDPRPFRAGDKLAAGSVVMRVVTPGKMKVELNLPENQAFWVADGMKAKVTPTALLGVSYDGTCAAPIAAPKSQGPGMNFYLSISLPDVDARLLPGMKANVKIEAEGK